MNNSRCEAKCDEKCGRCGVCFLRSPFCWPLYFICPTTVPSLYIKNDELKRILNLTADGQTNVDAIIAFADQLEAKQKKKQWSFIREFRNWFQTCFWFVLIAIFGAFVFVRTEHDTWNDFVVENEERRTLVENSLPLMDNITEVLGVLEDVGGNEDLVSDIRSIYNYYSNDTLWREVEEFPIERSMFRNPWDFLGALYFCFQTATAIGYGNATPRTDIGKAVLIPYSIVAILTLVWVIKTNIHIFRYYYSKDNKNLCLRIPIACLIVAVYLLLSGMVYTYLEEDWTFLDSVYFSWVTTSSIGFGDITPNYDSSMVGMFILLFVALQFVTFLIDTVERFMRWFDQDETSRDFPTMVSPDLLQEKEQSTLMTNENAFSLAAINSERGNMSELDYQVHI